MKTSAATLRRTIPSFDAAGFMINTVISGHLCVGSALLDPPFEFMDGDNARGFDVELMQAIAAELGLTWQLVAYTGGDFNGIFDGLTPGIFDCIASSTTITPERERKAAFCAPYTRSGQSLVCNVEATPHVRSIDDLHGMIIGVQEGNTSEPVAQRLKDEGRVAEVQTYAYHDIGVMLDDLVGGRIDAIMKLSPVKSKGEPAGNPNVWSGRVLQRDRCTGGVRSRIARLTVDQLLSCGGGNANGTSLHPNPLGRHHTPEHKEHNVTLPMQLNTAELNMTRAAKCKGKSCSQSNLALVFQLLIGSPNRVRTQHTTRAAQ